MLSREIKNIIGGRKVLIAVSGGVDSMVLLDLMYREGFNIGVVHFNHMIRDDSIDDELLVMDYCNSHDIALYTKAMDILKFCDEMKVSTELGARMMRHSFFDEIRKTYNYEYLALAHNADDVAEQMMFAMTRGSGVAGLAGMKEIDQERKIIRPLLGVFKDDIYKYANENNIKWHEDSSNTECDYDRNHIRNEIIPSFEARRNGVKTVLVRQSQYFSEVNNFIQDALNIWIQSNYQNFSFGREIYQNTHKLLRGEILKYIWNSMYAINFTSKRLSEVDKWIEHGRGNTTLFFGCSHELFMKKNIIYVRKKA